MSRFQNKCYAINRLHRKFDTKFKATLLTTYSKNGTIIEFRLSLLIFFHYQKFTKISDSFYDFRFDSFLNTLVEKKVRLGIYGLSNILLLLTMLFF